MASPSVVNIESPASISHPAVEDDKSSVNNLDEQYRKLFIGGLSYTTTDDKLKEYCSKYGEITECIIMRDREGRSRGFAFVSFKDRAMVDTFMTRRPHNIDGRQTEPKRAMSRDEASRPEGQLTVKKLFLGGMKEELTEDDLKNYFEKFGNIVECKIMKDKEEKLRGFAFITFDDYDSVDRCILEKPHLFNGKELDVRKAIPREQTSRAQTFLPHKINQTINSNYYQPHHMIPHAALPHPSYSAYAYFHPPNYLGKPMPLMGPTNACSQPGVLPHPALLFAPEYANNLYFPNQTYPSPPTSNSPSARTNNNNNNYHNHNSQSQDGLKNKSDADSTSTNEHLNRFTPGPANYATSVATKPRLTRHVTSINNPNSEQHRKLFIGGLSFKTTDDTLKEYVTKFGEVSDSLVMKDQNGQSRCFGFVTFTNPETIDTFMKQRPHTLDGRQIDPKRAMPREEANNGEVHLTVKKIFIGGIRDGLDENSLKKYFENFGQVNDCFLMHDQDGKTRGFAFLEFEDFDTVDKVILTRPHTIGEYRVDVKKAVPKDQRQIQAQQQQQQQQQLQQQQQQQQYVLQMHAAAAYQYYYNNPPYNLLSNGNCTLPISSPPALMTHSGSPHTGSDEHFSHIRTSNNNNNNISNTLRHIPARNNRRQSSHGSQSN